MRGGRIAFGEFIHEIGYAIWCHMGQWDLPYLTLTPNRDEYLKQLIKFVHLCDYIASRKLFDVTADELNEKFKEEEECRN